MNSETINLNVLTDMMMDVNISLFSTITAILFTLVATYIIRTIYIRYGSSMNNRAQFSNSFMLLGMTTCVVIIVVKYSLALSLGLVGALSIVRFRAAIKDPEELTVLFLVIAIGLSFGANQYPIGLVIAILGSIVIIFTGRMSGHDNFFENKGLVYVISGGRGNIRNFYKETISNVAFEAVKVTVKEYTVDGDTGQIVLQISANKGTGRFLSILEEKIESNGLDFSLVSEVGVAS